MTSEEIKMELDILKKKKKKLNIIKWANIVFCICIIDFLVYYEYYITALTIITGNLYILLLNLITTNIIVKDFDERFVQFMAREGLNK